MAPRINASKQTRWLNLIRLCRRSHLTIRDFCARRGISEPSFYSWRTVLKQRGLLDDLPPQPSPNPSPQPVTPAFVNLTLGAAEPAEPTPPTESTTIDLVLNERRLLRLRPGFDPATLLQLVRLLEEPAC